MSELFFKKNGVFSRLRSSISSRLVVRVPDEVSCCEFDCRKSECLEGEWQGCQQRLRYAERLRTDRGEASGES